MIVIVTASINAGEITFNWQMIWRAAIGGGLAYLSKNFFTPPQIRITDAPKEDIAAVEAIHETYYDEQHNSVYEKSPERIKKEIIASLHKQD